MTTREPDLEMLEVAIVAFNLAIYDGVLPQEEPATGEIHEETAETTTRDETNADTTEKVEQ